MEWDDRGYEVICSALEARKAKGLRSGNGHYLALAADAALLLGRPSDAMEHLENALDETAQGYEGYWEAELYRLKAEAILSAPSADQAEAETHLRRALEVAQQQGGRSLELRAAIHLASLWASQGHRKKAIDVLKPVFDWFTEGFDTPDLKEAKVLLDELA